MVGIGASAGGLEAFKSFYGKMPSATGMVNSVLSNEEMPEAILHDPECIGWKPIENRIFVI